MADQKIPKMSETETLVIVKKCRVREVNAEIAEPKQPGDKVQLKGLDKMELLQRGLATRDLDYKPKTVAAPAAKPVAKG